MPFLSDLADFLGPEIVAREITFKNKTRVFHFKVLGGLESESVFRAKRNDDGTSADGFRSQVIAAVLANEDGSNALTYDQAASLPNAFQNLLVDQCFDVNGLRTQADEASTPEAEAGNVP